MSFNSVLIVRRPNSVFSARQHTAHMLSALYAIYAMLARPSVRPSHRHTARVHHRKTVRVGIMIFSPYGSPITLVFGGKFYPEILRGFP